MTIAMSSRMGAGHVDGRVVMQTLPSALEWLWRDFPK